MQNVLPLVSIVVPVYNVEKYLERCIESILVQSYKNLEIILVDDGSTDLSGNICDQYARQDTRIKVIHKANGGLSDARNAGLEVIKGQWVTFIDSDDWINVMYIDSLLKAVNENGVDIAIAQYKNVHSLEEVTKSDNNYHIEILECEKALETLLYQKKFTTSACCKLYRSKLWGNIRFPVGKLYEDVETIYRIIKASTKVAYLDHILYYYFQRENSIVRTNFNIRKMDYVDVCRAVLLDVQKNYPHLQNAATSRLFWAEIHLIVHIDDTNTYKEQVNLLWNDIKRNRKKVLLDRNCRTLNKMIALLSYFGYKNLRRIFIILK